MSPDRPRRGSSSKQPRQGASKGAKAAASPLRKPSETRATRTNQAIPDAVANRMARRITIATGIPTVLGMGVFIASYLLVSRQILAIPPSATLLASGGCFLLGLVGLSYGVLSASWEDLPGTVLGMEQIPVNLGRIKTSLRALREGSTGKNAP
ncbi:MAG: photosystem II biosynthesis protein [Cyanobium sp.]